MNAHHDLQIKPVPVAADIGSAADYRDVAIPTGVNGYLTEQQRRPAIDPTPLIQTRASGL